MVAFSVLLPVRLIDYGLRDYGTAKWEGGDDECNHQVGRFEYAASEKQKSNNGSAGHQAHDTCPKCGAVRIDAQIGLEPTPDEYIVNMVAVFREVKRVLKDDGVLWLNIGDSYNGTGNISGEKQFENNKQGTNNGSRGFTGKSVEGIKPKDLIGIPWMLAFALRGDGWYLRQDIIWHKPNPMPESVKDRCTKAHEYVFLLTKSARYYYDAEAVSENSIRTGEYNNSRETHDEYAMHRVIKVGETRNKRSVWSIATQPTKEAHFATFPEKLVEPCILAGSRAGDTVFDPFMGSGTVARVAIRLGRNVIGTELNPDYIKIAQKRIAEIQPILAF